VDSTPQAKPIAAATIIVKNQMLTGLSPYRIEFWLVLDFRPSAIWIAGDQSHAWLGLRKLIGPRSPDGIQ
jgi:hypothetical protein